MTVVHHLADLLRWALAVAGGEPAPPRRALGLRGAEPWLMRREGDGYAPERPTRRGDAAPLLLDEERAVGARILAPVAAALRGPAAARWAAEAASPFPPGEATLGLAPAAEPWSPEGAPWLTAAAPRARLSAARAAVAAGGARPGRAFAMVEGRAVPLEPRPRRALPAALLAAALCVAAAHGWLGWRVAAAEQTAAARLAAARESLRVAETAAEARAAAAETAAAPLREAAAAAALLAAAPPAAGALEAFAAALPDASHAFRLSIAPGRIEAEIAAPDAAALAAALSAAPGFARAALADGARVDPATGLQRARLMLEPAPGPAP